MQIKFLLWNCNGISTRVAEVREYLRMFNVQILVLTETRVPNNFIFRIQNYKVVEKRGPVGHGGVAIAVREDVPFQDLSRHPALDGVEAAAVKLADNSVVVA
ncbi:hypothetical protein QE152_g27396 [Popillia japonica]